MEAVSLITVDERICKEVYKVEPHKKFWGSTVFNWFDTIGFNIAMGNTLQQTRNYYANSETWEEEREVIMQVMDFLEANYATKSFYSVSRPV